MLSVPYSQGHSVRLHHSGQEPVGSAVVSVPYSQGHSVRLCAEAGRKVASVVSVPYPQGHSVRHPSPLAAPPAPRSFQSPIHRVIACDCRHRRGLDSRTSRFQSPIHRVIACDEGVGRGLDRDVQEFQSPIHRVIACDPLRVAEHKYMLHGVSVPYSQGHSVRLERMLERSSGHVGVSVPYSQGHSVRQRVAQNTA